MVSPTKVNEKLPTPQRGFEVIIATVQSLALSPSNSPCYRYMDSVAGHLLSKLLSHLPHPPSLSSSVSFLCVRRFIVSTFSLLPLLSVAVLPSQLPPLPVFVVSHSGALLCVGSCVIDPTKAPPTNTQTNTHKRQKLNAGERLQKSLFAKFAP